MIVKTIEEICGLLNRNESKAKWIRDRQL